MPTTECNAGKVGMSEFVWHFPDLRNRPDLPNLNEIPLRIGQWHAREGNRVEMNQPLLTVETEEKDISLAIDSPVTGIIKSISLVTTQVVQTGDVLAIFEMEE